MRKITLGDKTLFISQQIFHQYQIESKIYSETLKATLEEATKNSLKERMHENVVKFLEAWKEKHPGIAVLDAHGHRDKNGAWLFKDGKRLQKVEDWINKNDGKYGCLVLCVCDEKTSARLPKTSSSILFIPDGRVNVGGGQEILGTQHHFSIIHPTFGEIDGYTAEAAIKELCAAT